VNPANGWVTAISSDWATVGEQFRTSPEEIVREAALTDADTFTFQHWMAPDNDVVCTISRISDALTSAEFALDGKTIDEQDQVIRILLDQVFRSADSTAAFLVDRRGGSLDVDWDAVIQGALKDVPVRPDMLGVRHDLADRLQAVHTRQPVTRFGEYTVLDWMGFFDSST
jgi:hypothetical protein